MTYRKPVPCPCDWPAIATESDRTAMSRTGAVRETPNQRTFVRMETSGGRHTQIIQIWLVELVMLRVLAVSRLVRGCATDYSDTRRAQGPGKVVHAV